MIASAEITKTSIDYTWILPGELTSFVKPIKELEGTGCDTFTQLKDSLRKFFSNVVLPKAGLLRRAPTNKLYNLRSVRSMRATQYVRLLKEYQVMGWEPKPLNPLTHTTLKTTLTKYAETGCDNEMQAKKRCVDKYFQDRNKW